VLGGIGNIPGAVVGGLLIGLIQALGGQILEVKWTDVIIFSILIIVLVFRPAGLFGTQTPQRA
jgi:branched-chain amino acid transport system permease protein